MQPISLAQGTMREMLTHRAVGRKRQNTNKHEKLWATQQQHKLENMHLARTNDNDK